MQRKRYNVLIIGGGPAGYTAALYCARAGLTACVLERLTAGGQMATTSWIDNYPGFENGVDGYELGEKMRLGAERFGVQTDYRNVDSVDLSQKTKIVRAEGEEFEADCIIIATGTVPRELGVTGERELRGRGISYCATCDGMFFKNKVVAVVGGGNTAAGDALFLARICKKVFIIHRRDTLRASRSYWSQIENNDKIEPVWNSVVEEIVAENNVKGIVVRDLKTQRTRVIDCDGVFAAIGRDPNTELFRGQVNMDESGYLLADETTKTNIPGVFAAGDVRVKQLRQIVTAVADGAQAAYNAEIYITESGIQ